MVFKFGYGGSKVEVDSENKGLVVKLSVFFGVLFLVAMFGLPLYNVWEQEQSGRAELAKAEYTRRVAVLEAQAKDDSATLLAEAEVKRANGVAKANAIIGASLEGNEAYLRYLWIQNLEHTGNEQIIYVPTEAGLPILEANRLRGS